MTVPGIVSSFVEPVLGILADTWRRRVVLLAGGVAFTVSLFLTAASPGAGLLLSSWILFSPASGAFVNMAQISLMDHDPARREQGMARWSFAGSIGMTAGPLALGAAAAIGLGWRGLYLAMGGVSAILVGLSWARPIPQPAVRGSASGGWQGFRDGMLGALRALRRRSVLRWLLLLEIADLMGDILFGFVALYFVDVAGLPAGQAAVAVVLWAVSGLVGDFLVIPLLERVKGLTYVRASAAVAALAFPAFLLVEPPAAKAALLTLVGLAESGWYSVLKAGLYAAMPGKGGAAMAVSNVAGLAGSVIPLGLGLVAEAAGLRAAMWLLLAAPVTLLVALPRVTSRRRP